VRLGRKVALKVLTGLAGLSPKSVKRFRREAEVTARLDHPGICTTYDFGEEDGMPWIAMRYVEGQTLSARIADARSPYSPITSEHLSFAADGDPPSPGSVRPPTSPSVTTTRTRDDITWVVGIIERTARALHVAHENGVVHRDMKPANIMIGQDGNPVILDFGLANVVEADGDVLTRPDEIMGTPQYIAPEQLARHGIQIDRRADIYSLGVTLYEALTLTRPFEAPTRERLYQAIIAKDPPDPHTLNHSISKDLSAVVSAAIEKDRNRRYQTALDFAEDLKRVLQHEPVVARRAGPLIRLTRWAERNPGVAISLGTLFLVLTAALVGTLFLLGKRNETLTELERELDRRRVSWLTSLADTLYPLVPAKVPEIKSWLAKADDVGGRLAKHENALREVAASQNPEDQEKRATLNELVNALKEFLHPDPTIGIVAEVRRRLGTAETIWQRSIGDYKDRWDAAIASIRADSEQYKDLRMGEQIGLVPLGRNEASGFWEFAVLDSGTIPKTDGRVSAFTFEESTAVVLILLPGGPCTTGSPTNELGHVSAEALQNFQLPSFFVGKYEVTQWQWQHVMGSNPTTLKPDKDRSKTLAHPVDMVTWNEAFDFARRLNLLLPSEIEWEYACRANSETVYTWGNDPDVLKDHANVADLSLQNAGREKAPSACAKWTDGYPEHAPVNKFKPNAFGLFGLHGNVGEWCRDWYRQLPVANVPAGGGSIAEEYPERSWRDGSWLTPPGLARAAARHRYAPMNRSRAVGLRVVRVLDSPAP
jgi:formylglycine-generating enzyme required for sulfatase activity